MTRPAGLSLIHFVHREAPGRGPGSYNTVMTLTAGKILEVPGMTEGNCSGILDSKDSICWCSQMAFFTICGDAESCIAFMTRSTRFSLFHLQHRITDTAYPANKNCAVAFTTFKHLEMGIMTESCIKSLKPYIHDIFMTFLAIAFGGKSRFPVVTDSTRLSRIHIIHGVSYPIWAWNKDFVVTFRARK